MKFNIIKRSLLWIVIGFVLVIFSVLFFLKNMRFSKEFTGGVEMKIETQTDAKKIKNDLTSHLNDKGFQADVFVDDKGSFLSLLIKMPVDDDQKVANISLSMEEFLLNYGHISSKGEILESSIIGATVGNYMKKSAVLAVVFGLVFIAIYMIFAFAGMRTVISPLILSLVVIITMIFDIAIPAGAYGIRMGMDQTIQVDTIFIIAILTTMGYSINDTIIIFDRIRENLIRQHASLKDGKQVLGKILEDSLWQTMRRSIGTSFSLLVVILAMYLFGTGIIKLFSFTIGIGVFAGSFSSIFIAAPLVYLLIKAKK